jgi:hypothetical protein
VAFKEFLSGFAHSAVPAVSVQDPVRLAAYGAAGISRSDKQGDLISNCKIIQVIANEGGVISIDAELFL